MKKTSKNGLKADKIGFDEYVSNQVLVMTVYDDDTKEMRSFDNLYYVGKFISALKPADLAEIKYITVIGNAKIEVKHEENNEPVVCNE